MALSIQSDSLQNPGPSGMQWGLTHTEVAPFCFTWTVDNFSHCFEKVGEKITSPTFTIETRNKGYYDDNIDCYIDLYPMGINEISIIYPKYIALYLRRTSKVTPNLRANVNFSLLSSNKEQIHSWNSPVAIFDSKSITCGTHKFIERCFLNDKCNNFLPQDKLIIRCKVFIKVGRINSNGQEKLFQIQRSYISEDIGKLLKDMTLTDVTLVAGGKEIRAHKLILVARSKVFAAMFEYGMQEQKLNRVDITDVDHDTLTEMLNFMYTDRAHNLDKMAADLLAAADKYALDGLKVMCEEALYKNLSVKTAADTLVLAELHSAAVLKEHTIAFINSGHATTVMATEGWKNMTMTNPILITELFRALSLQVQH